LLSIWYSFRRQQGTVQGKTGRNTTTNPSDERVDEYTKDLVGHRGQERAWLYPNGRRSACCGRKCQEEEKEEGRDSGCWFSALKLLENAAGNL
jgi:hypothetical protein